MSYFEDSFQRAHTGNGGMTTSLAMGVAGSAAQRRAAMFPLSPLINNGRSQIVTANAPLLDPRAGEWGAGAACALAGIARRLVDSHPMKRAAVVDVLSALHSLTLARDQHDSL